MLSGFVNIIKPTGMTSSDVVIKIKKILGTKKVGHLGTLDPAASGVLVCGIGRCTKFFDYFLNKDKVYRALVKFGVETDTLDSFGNITNTSLNEVTENQIGQVLPKFEGELLQTPPKFSAKKINGEKAYDLARKNINFELKPQKISVFSIKLVKNCGKNLFLFEVHCSAGTYIRKLFSDIAKAMNTASMVPVIIRTKCGAFKIDDAITLDEFEKSKKITLVEDVFSETKFIEVDENLFFKLKNGQRVESKTLAVSVQDGCEFFVTFGGQIIGFYQAEKGTLKQKVYLLES